MSLHAHLPPDSQVGSRAHARGILLGPLQEALRLQYTQAACSRKSPSWVRMLREDVTHHCHLLSAPCRAGCWRGRAVAGGLHAAGPLATVISCPSPTASLPCIFFTQFLKMQKESSDPPQGDTSFTPTPLFRSHCTSVSRARTRVAAGC